MGLAKYQVWEGILSPKMKEDKRKQVEREKPAASSPPALRLSVQVSWVGSPGSTY